MALKRVSFPKISPKVCTKKGPVIFLPPPPGFPMYHGILLHKQLYANGCFKYFSMKENELAFLTCQFLSWPFHRLNFLVYFGLIDSKFKKGILWVDCAQLGSSCSYAQCLAALDLSLRYTLFSVWVGEFEIW